MLFRLSLLILAGCAAGAARPVLNANAPAASGTRLPPGDVHPNEPAGYVRFAENDGSTLNSGEAAHASAVVGSWHPVTERNGLLSIVEDRWAPASPPSVIRTKYPQGFRAGRAPVNWGGWDSTGLRLGQKSKVYLSLWLKIEGNDYENEPAGTKLGFIGYGQSPERAHNQGYFLLNGVGSRAIRHSFSIRFVQQNHVSRSLPENVGRRAALTIGSWHHWEVDLEENTLGAANGVFKMWMDGDPVMDYRNVVYITPGNDSGFHDWKWNPTWGGGSHEIRTRDDYIDLDHIYISGVPTEEARRAATQQ